MSRWAGLAMLFLIQGFAPLHSAEDAPASETGNPPCRIGFSSSMFTEINENDAKASVKVWAQVLFKERKLPVDPDPKVIHGTEAITRALRNKQIDCIAMPTDEFALVSREVPLGLVIVSFKDGSATEEYVLLVRQDSGVERVEDLRNHSLVLFQNPRASLARVWLDTLLGQKGVGATEEFFGPLTQGNKLSRVILPVFFRQTDACVVTRHGFETMRELNPQIGRQLKILATSPKVVPVAFWFRRDYSPPFMDRLLEEMGKVHATAAGQQVLTIFQSDRIEQQPMSILQSALDLLAARNRFGSVSNRVPNDLKGLYREPKGEGH